MTQRRITKNDVRSVFVNFCQAAQRAGFNTVGWTLLHPKMKGYAYRLQRSAAWQDENGHQGQRYTDTPFPPHLYATERETYQQISAWIQCLTAIRDNRDNGGN